MIEQRQEWRAWAAVVVLAAALFGCSANGGEGAVELAAAALSSADVVSATVTVTASDISPPIVVPLSKMAGQWGGVISGIPAGTNRTFTLSGRDAAGTEIYTGRATGVTVTAGQTVMVVIVAQQTAAPVPLTNAAPIIDALLASAASVGLGDTVNLRLNAHDPDAADVLDYLWTAPAGTFDAPMSATTKWTAPATAGMVRLTARVRDQKNAQATITLDINVSASNGKGKAKLVVSFNSWPVVTGIGADPARIDVQEITTLDVAASDADGDTLSYLWSANCSGAFTAPATRSPTFKLTAAPPSGTCTFTVQIGDGRGGANTASLTIATGPQPAVNQAPQIVGSFQSSETAAAGEVVVLRIRAVDPDGAAVAFTWSAGAGTLGAAITMGGDSEVRWTAPADFSGSAEIEARVSDGSGLFSIETFTVHSGAGAGGSDTTPPTLAVFSFAPTSIDTLSDTATVHVTFRLTDDLAGVSHGVAYFRSPSGQQTRSCTLGYWSLGLPAPTTSLSGTCDAPFPRFGEGGTWTVETVYMVDAVGNARYLATADLQATGFPTTLTVTSQQDIAPPVLGAFSFSPAAIDTTGSLATLAVNFQVTDDLSGVSHVVSYFRSPSGQQTRSCTLGYWSLGLPGPTTSLSGSCDVPFPQFGEGGTWTVETVYIVDAVGNARYLATADIQTAAFPTTLSVTSQHDVTAPVLSSFSFQPASIDTGTSSATVQVTFQLTDDLSGVSHGVAYFRSPSGQQTRSCTLGYWSLGLPAPTTPLSGSCDVPFPQFGEGGAWTVETVYMVDAVGNSRYLATTDLQTAGFATTLVVSTGS